MHSPFNIILIRQYVMRLESKLEPVGNAELLVYAVTVRFYRLLADVQLLCDLLVFVTLADMGYDLLFSVCQADIRC